MEYAVVSIAALIVSVLALYSGFGLGTLLIPVFAIFFPVPVAVTSTAVVHLANNIFRVTFERVAYSKHSRLADAVAGEAYAVRVRLHPSGIRNWCWKQRAYLKIG